MVTISWMIVLETWISILADCNVTFQHNTVIHYSYLFFSIFMVLNNYSRLVVNIQVIAASEAAGATNSCSNTS